MVQYRNLINKIEDLRQTAILTLGPGQAAVVFQQTEKTLNKLYQWAARDYSFADYMNTQIEQERKELYKKPAR